MEAGHLELGEEGLERELLAVLPFGRAEVGIEIVGEGAEDVDRLGKVERVGRGFVLCCLGLVAACGNTQQDQKSAPHSANSFQLSSLVTLTFLLPTRIPIQRPLSLPHVPLPLLRHRQPRRLGRAEPLAPGVRRVKGLAELLDLDRLEVGEGRGEGGPEEGVEGEGEGGAFEADVLVGVGEDLGQDGQDGLERDGFGAVGSGEGGWEGRVSVRMGSSS